MLLKMSVPVYKRGRWNRLELDGKIELSSEVDTLSEGYQSLKQEVDAFLLSNGPVSDVAAMSNPLDHEF